MALTALEIRKQEFKRMMRGYSPIEVRRFLELVASEMESLTRTNIELKERVRELEAKVKEYEGKENLLKETLTTVQQTASRIKEEARKEAEEILQEAREYTETHQSQLTQDIEELKEKKRRFIADFRALLESYLKTLNQLESEEENP